jgi:hypothetical protein
MKQTAVEWLVSQMKDDRFLSAFEKEFKQAKEMEKEQIIEAFDEGYGNGGSEWGHGNGKRGEEHYKETFKKKIMKDKKLKVLPCPFCGSDAKVIEPEYGSEGRPCFIVSCDLNSHSLDHLAESAEEAISLWNQRVEN